MMPRACQILDELMTISTLFMKVKDKMQESRENFPCL